MIGMDKMRPLAAVLIAAVILCGLCTPVFGAASGETEYVVNVYNERNGLPTGEANTVVQTRDGYVWIGSYGGLIRYDGSSFYNYSTEGILPTSSVRALFEDSLGRLWVGTNDAGVFWLENGELYAVENPEPKTYLCVRGFDEGEDGVIYVASNSGMGEIREGKLTAYAGEYASGRTVYSVGVDSRGRVWGALNSGECVVTKDGETLRVFTSQELFDDLEIYCSAADRAGRVYLGTSGSVMARLTFPGDSLEPKDLEIEYLETPSVTTHNSIAASDEGWIVVCGNVGACILGPEGEETVLTAESGASAVNYGCVDYEGDIWLASTSSGILKYTHGYFSSPNSAAGLTDVAINAIVRRGGSAYLGTNTGLLIFDENWQPVENELTQLLEGARIRSLLVDRQERVWVASYVNQDPVICYDPADGSLLIFTTDDGLVNSSARSLLELSDGGIAVGTQGGLSIIRNDEVAESYTAADGIEVGSILCLLEGHDGSLLLGSDGGGIYEIKDGKVTNHSDAEGLNDGVVLRMIRDTGNTGYFISAGSSLYHWDGDSFRKLTIRKGAGSIFDFFIRDGKLWILQNSGILAFDLVQLLGEQDPLPQQFSFAHGLTGSLDANTWNWLDEDGSLYLATRSGISVFGFETVTGTLPKGIISRVRTDSGFYNRPESVEIEKNVNRVTVDFAVLSFTETYDVGFTYMLEGFDGEETTVTGEKSGSISYTNLPGGAYTFKLRIFLLEHPELYSDYTLTIVKESKLWERTTVKVLAAALLVLLVAAVVALIYRAKIRRIEKRQEDYRSIIGQLLKTFARTTGAEEPRVDGHPLRVAEYARELARRMGQPAEEQENIYCVALLHDIVSDELLHSSGEAAGQEVPLAARIITVADAYDNLSGEGHSRHQITDELLSGSGTQFDPEVVRHMLGMMEEKD